MSQFIKVPWFVMGVLTTVIVVGCGTNQDDQTTTAINAPVVSVAEVVSLRISEWDEFSGRLSAPETVALKPRVSGYIEKVLFTEGALVQKDQILLTIDAKPFEIEVERLQAQLDSTLSREELAASELSRGRVLIEQNAISQEALDTRSASLRQAKADTAAIEAALKRARLDLSYTSVKAPVTGRVSRAQVTEGNFVTAGQSELTRIVSVSKMYAYFNIDEQTYLNYVRDELIALQNDALQPVTMALAGDATYHYSGYIDFIDNQVNEESGSITVRAAFDNRQGVLIPGLFARIRLAGTPTFDGILIDEKAIGTDLNNKYVLVVGNGNTVEYRPITLGESLGELRIVTSGLQAGDDIVVNGLQRVMPGMQVSPDTTIMADAETIAAIESEQSKLDPSQIALITSFSIQAGQ